MTLLIVRAVIAGHLIFAQHEFGDRAACKATGAMVERQLIASHAENIEIHCFEEPAL